MLEVQVVITDSPTLDQRRIAHALFSRHIPNIAPNAIPLPEADDEYLPVLALAYRGRVVVGAALVVRPKNSAMAYGASKFGRGRYNHKWDGVRELDLLAVDVGDRDSGVGSAIVTALQEHLVASDVKYLIGSALPEDTDHRLQRFYEKHGFTIRATEEGHPPYFGLGWNAPAPLPVAFYFGKRLDRAPTGS